MKLQQLVVLALLLVGYVNSALVQPNPDDYAPCVCLNGRDEVTLYVECSNHNLDDTKISAILNSFLVPGISPIGALILTNNQLTKIPDQLKQFTQLTYIDLDDNKISYLTADALSFTSKIGTINLGFNQLTSIAPGTFEGSYGSGSYIGLYSNLLTRFESTVFQTVLQQLAPYAGTPFTYVDIDSNAIDCKTDPCHLAWLIRDNPNLLKVVGNGRCTDGTRFEDIDPKTFFNTCGTVVPVITCPPASSIAPCICTDSGDGLTTALNCNNMNLNDTMASTILKQFLIPTTGVSPLSFVSIKTNQLTTVPTQINQLTQLTKVDLSFNSITLVRAGSFYFTDTLKSLKLDSNTLATISPGAFNGTGYGSGSVITLTGNSVTLFQSGVFQSVLKGMATGGNNLTTYIDVAGSPFDCKSPANLCHLAWLIRDEPNLLNFVQNAVCDDGTAFKDLNPTLFDSCPITCPKTNGNYIDGNYADPMATPSSCGKFYQCSKGTAYTFECSTAQTGLVFNPETKVCDTLINVPSCFEDFVCPNKYGNFPKIPPSCTNYWLCADGTSYDRTCPGDLVFNPDPAKMQCDKIANVGACNVKKVPMKLLN